MSDRSLTHPKYRPEIDGLRAVAVLSVVIFHAFPEWIPGGFIGVDIFFVISGFLISTIIFENLENNSFSFATFYKRRIKRIFPALLVVLAACYLIGWLTLLANEYRQLGKHIAAGAGFISNLVLWNEAGYFDTSSDAKPLLHLWSLGIEEQFYIVWPLLMWLAWKQRLGFFLITLFIAFTSLFLNLWCIKNYPVATFYSPLTRFWELLSGSLLAWITLYRQGRLSSGTGKLEAWLFQFVPATLRARALFDPMESDRRSSVSGWSHFLRRTGIHFVGKCSRFGTAPAKLQMRADTPRLDNFLALAGLLVLAFGTLHITREMPFPGGWAMLPVLGAVLIIAAGPAAWTNRVILRHPVMIWFGLISYPLYLWHWPILSFARILIGETPHPNVRLIAVLLAIVLAWLTYAYLEQPIRRGATSKAQIKTLASFMAALALIGIATDRAKGLKFREVASLGGDTIAQHKHIQMKDVMANECGIDDIGQKTKFAECASDTRGNVRFALMGDSKADALYPGLISTSDKRGRWLFIGGTSKSGALVPLMSPDPAVAAKQTLVNSAVRAIASNKEIKIVVIVASIRGLFKLSDGVANGNVKTYNPKYLSELRHSKRYSAVFDGVQRTISHLIAADKKVVLVVDNPALPSPQDCIDRKINLIFTTTRIIRNNPECSVSLTKFNTEIALYRKLLAALSSSFAGQLEIFDATSILCDESSGVCGPTRNGQPLYSYTDHISKYAAGLIGERLNAHLYATNN